MLSRIKRAVIAAALLSIACGESLIILYPSFVTTEKAIYDQGFQLSGSGFGNASVGSYIRIDCDSGDELQVGSLAADQWNDDFIFVRRNPSHAWPTLSSTDGCEFNVYVKGQLLSGPSGTPITGVWEVTEHDLKYTGFVLPHPISVDVDPETDIAWGQSELVSGICEVGPGAPHINCRDIPQHIAGEGIFYDRFAKEQTPDSGFAESVLVLNSNSIWGSQGGDWAYNEASGVPDELNASRVFEYIPSSDSYRCFLFPWNNAAVAGFTYDNSTGTMWAALSGHESTTLDQRRGALVSWRPSTFTSTQTDCLYDFPDYLNPNSYPAVECTGGSTSGCYTLYELPLELTKPDGSPMGWYIDPAKLTPPKSGDPYTVYWPFPAHLELLASGEICFTLFMGQALGCLNPQVEVFEFFELPHTPTAHDLYENFAAGTWDIIPGSTATEVCLTQFFTSEFLCFDFALAATNNCNVLDVNDKNPCVTDQFQLVLHPDDQKETSVLMADQFPNGTYVACVATGNETVGNARPVFIDRNAPVGAQVIDLPTLAIYGGAGKDGCTGVSVLSDDEFFVMNAHGNNMLQFKKL